MSTQQFSLLILALLGPTIGPFATAEPDRPNILYFYVDDMGWGSIGPNGQEERRAGGLPSVQTPNLDQLAAEGVNFTRAYGCTVCSPARSSQQTGYHQGHTFADRNDPDNAKKAMRKEDVTMGDALSRAGYTTGYWGKWGYGGSKDQENPTIDNVQTLPTSHGYQHVLAELHHVRAHTFFQPTLWSAPVRKGKGVSKSGLELIPNSMSPYREDSSAYPDAPAHHRRPQYPETAYCDDVYAFAALDFVRTNARRFRETGEPFFGLLAVQIPHAPFDEIATLPEWDQAYAEDPHFRKLAPQSQQWAAMVTRIDAHFGHILAALEDPDGDGDSSDSIAEDTLVIYMSDNGGPGGKNNGEYDANGGLRGNKGTIYEGGIRVPTIMRWPAKISSRSALKAGTDCDRVIDVSDLLPTFCELAGVEAPVGLDGVSLAPFLTGKGESRPRDFLIHEAGKGKSIIRGNDKLIRTKEGPELYDLAADPGETKNLAGEELELVSELEKLLLGERVDEPRGFSNTYHHWTGADGAKASQAKNWSDYVYANAGITYQEDMGPPQLSWTAVMENRETQPSVAVGDADLEFLGLEIRGHAKEAAATQELALSSGVGLTGRNEIRISEGGILSLDGGSVSSLRWVDVKKGGLLRGSGKIEGTVYQAGKVEIGAASGDLPGVLRVAGDYRSREGSRLRLALAKRGHSALEVEGMGHLRGKLSLHFADGFLPEPDTKYVLVSAEQLSGRFEHPNDIVVTGAGIRLRLHYLEDRVVATVLPRFAPSTT